MVSSGSNSLATNLGVKKSVDELQVNMDSFVLVDFDFDFSLLFAQVDPNCFIKLCHQNKPKIYWIFADGYWY